MKTLFQSLLLLLARATDRQLARHVQFLKTENGILRARLPERLQVTPQERQRLLKFGKPLGTAIKDLISIVSPRTFLRWLQGEEQAQKKPASSPQKPGRPRTEQEIRDLVLKLARENGWGYTRILGELKKLGVRTISRSTVVNILKSEGIDPGPKRGEGPGTSSSNAMPPLSGPAISSRRKCGRWVGWWRYSFSFSSTSAAGASTSRAGRPIRTKRG
jgi:putative transposase